MGEEGLRAIMAARRKTAVASILFIVCALPVTAQDEPVRVLEGVYQEDVAYRVGDQLEPRVEVDGVRWLEVSVAPRDGEELTADQDARVEVRLSFDNRERRGATLIVVLLLEDEEGGQLHRLSLPEMRLGGNRAKEYDHKEQVPGQALLDTRRMYLFFRVQ